MKSQIKNLKPIPTLLSIAGSDSSAGAGIQADLKTVSSLGGYLTTVITAVTSQNTSKVKSSFVLPPHVLKEQIDTVVEDIKPEAVKIGMIPNLESASTIVEAIKRHQFKNIVFDPVMVSTSGRQLMREETIEYIKSELIPLITVLTPNLDETTVLTDLPTNTENERIYAAREICDLGCEAVLVKGGHLEEEMLTDLLYTHDDKMFFFTDHKIESENTHGTGCTLSSAIAFYLAKGEPLEKAVHDAKKYLLLSLKKAQVNKIGKGNGPLIHF